MKAKVSMNIQGYATWHIKNAKGEIVRENATPYPNLIVDTGLEIINNAAPTNQLGFCGVGTGSTPPAGSDTSLETPYGPQVTGITREDTEGTNPDFFARKRSYQFSAGTIDSVALAEFGIRSSSTQWSRLLFRDGSLNPITLTLTPDEVLVIVYEITLYPDTADVTGTFDVDDGSGGITTHSYTLRPAEVNFSQWGVTKYAKPFFARLYETDILGDVENSPSGTNVAPTSYIPNIYVANSRRNVYSLACDLTNANFPTGIGAIRFYGNSAWQISFSPKLAKDATKTLNFPDFIEFSWAAGTP